MAMFRFTIRDVLWLTVVAGLLMALLTELRQHAATTQELTDTKKAKLAAETGWQISAVEHNKTLRVIEENSLEIIGHADGTTTLRKADR